MSIKNLVVFSDLHAGDQLAVCPPEVTLDNGGTYHQSKQQEKLYALWTEFWDDWVPKVTRGEKYIIINNGDTIDGVHHGSTNQISHNLEDQKRIAYDLLVKRVKHPKCAGYYHIRGTEAHIGKSGQEEESLAKALGAKKDEVGNHSRWELWLKFGSKKSLVHFTHHVGTTGSASYESTAIYKELIEAYTEAGRFKLQPPDVVVRSHRHRHMKIEISGAEEKSAISTCTPCWQLKTPFAYRVSMGRSAMPQIGGLIIREGDEVPLYVRPFVKTIPRPRTEEIE